MNINAPPPSDYESQVEDLSPEVENDDIQANAPKVRATPGRAFIVVILFLIIMGLVAYVIFGEEEKPEATSASKSQRVSKEVAQNMLPPPPPPAPLPSIRPLLPPTELPNLNPSTTKMGDTNAPQLPPLPGMPNSSVSGSQTSVNGSGVSSSVTPPPLPLPATPSARLSEAGKKGRSERYKSGMMVFGSGTPSSSNADLESKERKKAADSFAASDNNLAFANSAVAASKSASVKAERVKNLNVTIAQGKMIHAVLETAINTQLPAQLRAVISHDIYAEAGNARLIPKGSRLIGTYNTGIANGQNRVYIIWTRIIRPDGTDMMIGSPGVDALGRGGLAGNLDNRYSEVFAGSVLTSILGIGVAVAAESVIDTGQSTSTTSAQGDTTTNQTPSAQATTQGVDSINNTAKGIVGMMLDVKPVITIDQGTIVNVMVNKDLVFPSNITSQFGAVAE